MPDRVIVYPGQIPLASDVLSTNRNEMIATGYALRATLGTGTLVDGLPCIPTLPASMQVNVGQGSIMTLSTIDSSAYGTIPTDLNPLMKMGINPFGSTTFTLTAPGVSGQTINYLVEAQLVEADGSPIALPYYNASNPSQPFTGPNNNQAQQNTVRSQRVGLQLKAGAPASAGTQQTPAVDAGWVGLYVITVNFAQTTIVANSITVYPGAPFIGAKIPNLAPLSSPNFINSPTAPTPPFGDISTRLATTAFLSANHVAPTFAEIIAGLGFTPVQQGGGGSQEANHKLFLGYEATQGPRLTVDGSDLGPFSMRSQCVFTPNVDSGFMSWPSKPGLSFQMICGGATIASTGTGPNTTLVTMPFTFTTSCWGAIANFIGNQPPTGGSVGCTPFSSSSLTLTVNAPANASNGIVYFALGF